MPGDRSQPTNLKPSALLIEHLDPGRLRAYALNARAHPRRQINQLKRSIARFGFVAPALINASDGILAGHARIEAAKQLGLRSVPCIRVEHLRPEEERAYRLADNRLAELASWDRELLGQELRFLFELELDFELEGIGFETTEVDLLIEEVQSKAAPDRADDLPEIDLEQATVSQLGDLWLLGKHRLLCADARDRVSFDRLLEGERAQLVFADPPYNVPIHGHASGLGRLRHREFAMASGEMSPEDFRQFLATVCANLIAASGDGAIHFICIDWRNAHTLLDAASPLYTALKNICVWNKSNGGMGSLYRSKHELVLVWKSGTAPHINNVELGRSGRNRTNVWDYPGVNHFRAGREDELAMHPTVKPVALVADAIRDCTKRGGLVLDPFAGSGTTIIAAEQTGRRAAAIELDPHYIDTAIRRWQSYGGDKAIHAQSGRSFADTEQQRRGAPGDRLMLPSPPVQEDR
jgi:DNA modification methylase